MRRTDDLKAFEKPWIILLSIHCNLTNGRALDKMSPQVLWTLGPGVNFWNSRITDSSGLAR